MVPTKTKIFEKNLDVLKIEKCKKITCAEVNEIFQNLCRSSCAEDFGPKFTCAEVCLPYFILKITVFFIDSI